MSVRARRLIWTWTPPRIVAACLWAVLALLVFRSSAGVFHPDVKPEVYLAPLRSLNAYLSAWQSTPELGFPSFNVGLAPVTAVVALIRGFGLDADTAARVVRLILLTLAASGAAQLARQALRPPVSAWVGLAAAIIYIANPYTVVAGGTLAVLWPYALLPWLVSFLMRAVTAGRGWRWPAAAALAFAAMTGMNAGVVPLIQLVAVPPFIVLARHRAGCSWAQVGAAMLRWLLLATLLSAYWLVPTLGALGAGQTVVQNSETASGIAVVSSWAEVLRGLGLWPLYGGDANGPWIPEQVAYLTSIAVVFLSFGWTLLVGASITYARGAVRVAALAVLVLTVTVMVGIYPSPFRSPFAVLLAAGFEHVPGLAAFRTTNKAGAGLVLAAAVAVSAAVQRALRHPGDARRVGVGIGLVAVVLVGATAPVWTGGMYTSPMPIPDYWRQAAADLDAGPAQQRVWLLPGQVSSDYRWSRQRPDDLGNSLFERPTLVRYVIPITGGEAANLLQAVDQGLQEGSLPAGSLSTVARRLGVGDVLVRNDVVWETTAGARPQVVQEVVNADHGLQPVRNYGQPGENTVSPTVPPANLLEAELPPVQHYHVADASNPIRAESTTGTVIVSGDGFGVPPAMSAGIIGDGVPYRYAGDLTESTFASILDGGARIVLTDSNRRRTTVAGRLTGGLGPLLRPDQSPGPTRALFRAEDQTTLGTTGVRVDATMTGSVFGTLSQASPVNAVDADPATAWWFGDFSTAVGQSLTVTSAVPNSFGSLSIRTVAQGPVHITSLRVRAGDRTADATVGADGVAHVDLGGVRADRVTVVVTGIGGDGFNMVGIADISGVPHVNPVASLPSTVDRLVSGLSASGLDALARTPVDVLLNRVTGVASSPDDDEERGLERDFTLPVDRTYGAYGSVTPAADLPETELDRLAGSVVQIMAQSSSRAFGLPTVRASQAIDGSPSTGWAPAVPQGAWIRFTGPTRSVDSVTVTQPLVTWHGGWATRMQVLVDGHVVGEGEVGPGTRTVHVTPSVGRSVELRITRVSGSGTVTFLETDAAGGSMTFDPHRAAAACVDIATLDGRALPVHPLESITSSAAVGFGPCLAGSIELDRGTHQLRGSPGWVVDSLVLRDRSGEPVTAAPAPIVTAVSGSTSADVDVAASTSPYYLVVGEAYDPRWSATIDGRDLGRPLVLDGWSVGWLVPAGGAHHIVVRYTPQRLATAALAASLVGLGLCGLLLRRSPVPEPDGRDVRPPPARDPRRRSALVWGSVVLGALLLGGAVAGAAALVLAAWCLLRPPRPAVLIGLGLGLWGSVAVAFVVGNGPRWGTVTPELVSRNPWPGQLALVGLVVLVAGIVRQVTVEASGTLPNRG